MVIGKAKEICIVSFISEKEKNPVSCEKCLLLLIFTTENQILNSNIKNDVTSLILMLPWMQSTGFQGRDKKYNTSLKVQLVEALYALKV